MKVINESLYTCAGQTASQSLQAMHLSSPDGYLRKACSPRNRGLSGAFSNGWTELGVGEPVNPDTQIYPCGQGKEAKQTSAILPVAGPRFVRTEALQQFQDDLQPYLYMKDVYRHTTENVRVTVIPFYIGQDAQIHWWRYCVRIENLGEEMVQLRSRHWEIFSGSTREEPVLTTTYPVFQYMSTIPLESPTGTMGFYTMERENGTTFECKIPTFKLEKYSDKHKTIVYPNTNDSTS
ncbi:PDIP2-like protein [Mya arenaria]|uniref:PDIP2-like protein n=1 Tax=Mya arenaria TaxID=6604 RepID=A0ABY7E0C3_MYAAR|nr:PDIP2-like protein [Mya arenaria]